MYSVKCEVWSVEYKVQGRGVWSVKCKVWSVGGELGV